MSEAVEERIALVDARFQNAKSIGWIGLSRISALNWNEDIPWLITALRAALADAARMKAGLEKFGHHDSICTQWSHFSGASIRDPHARCTCGLSAALTAPAREGEKI